jgi:hypothetical protein
MTNKRVAFGCVVAALAVSLSSCSFLFGALPGSAVVQPTVQHVPYSGSFKYTVDPGSTARDVYFVFTNPDLTQDSSIKPAVSGTAIAVDGKSLPAPMQQPLYGRNSAPRTAAQRLAELNRDPFRALGLSREASRSSSFLARRGTPSCDTVNDSRVFNDLGLNTPATCRYVSPTPIAVADGSTRTLNIWVADDCWVGTGTTGATSPNKRHLVDSTMVAELANRFLKAGADNDIYDWDTAVVGAEWGPNDFGNLIPPNDEITILLSDISNDNSDNGGVVGYFSPANNFTSSSVPGSNERIMFVIDAVMYANPNDNGYSQVGGSGWAATDYWAEEVFSTLAHELQHMIQFYQKQVRYDVADTASWINEMCSMIMEDLVADKLHVKGPRGVSDLAYPNGTAGAAGNSDGRLSMFNENSYFPLAQMGTMALEDYSTAYAFGAWLARNYGGAKLLKRIVQRAETDETAVVKSVAEESGRTDESMTRLLEKWAAAVLLSDAASSGPAGYLYNTGGWMTSSSGGISYDLGSIDLFDYSPTLNVFTATGSVPSGVTFSSSSNVYYEAAAGLASARTWSITVPQGIVMSVVLEPAR